MRMVRPPPLLALLATAGASSWPPARRPQAALPRLHAHAPTLPPTHPPAHPPNRRHRSSPSGSSLGDGSSLPVSSRDPLFSYILATRQQQQQQQRGRQQRRGRQQPGDGGGGGGGGGGAARDGGGAAAHARRPSWGSASHASHAAHHDVRAWAIPFADLAISRSIGEGSFGRVYEAEWCARCVWSGGP